MQHVAVEPRLVELVRREARRDAAVGGHRAVAVRADERHDDAGRAVAGRPRELDAARRQLGRDERGGRVAPELRDAPRLGAERRGPRRDVRRLAAGAGARPRTDVVARRERLLEAHDHVEQGVAERCDPHSYNRPMDGGDRRARARSFLIGGLVGASAAIATARRRRDVARRRAQRRTAPAGLAGFESAPCFREQLEDEPPPGLT